MLLFFDTNVLIRLGRALKGSLVTVSKEFSEAKYFDIVTTEITLHELERKFVGDTLNELSPFTRPHIRDLARNTLGIDLPEISRAEIEAQAKASHRARIASFLGDLQIKTLSVDAESAKLVSDQYLRKEGFFGPDAKKDQFPDALNFAVINKHRKEFHGNPEPLLIITDDNDFDAVAGLENVRILKGVEELLTNLGVSPVEFDFEDFLQRFKPEVDNVISNELESWGLNVRDVKGGEIMDFQMLDSNYEMSTAYKIIDPGIAYVLFCSGVIKLDVSYVHPDWNMAIKDSETKELYTFGDVAGNTVKNLPISFSLDVYMDGDKVDMMHATLRTIFGLYVGIEEQPEWS
jgi:predicted nucleic acid-binding protein